MLDYAQKNISQGNSLLSLRPQRANMSLQSFEQWRKFIYDRTGIYFQDNKKYLLESRLQKRLTYLGQQTFEDYYQYIRYNGSGQSEMKYLFDAITINETFFFRSQPQLDALVTTVLPGIIASKEKLGKNKIRIWSAACSSGEEAYSVAMMINDMLRLKYPSIEFEIIGTDINTSVVETAKKGIYKEYAVRNTPVYYMRKYFRNNGASYELDSKIRDMAQFKLLNLNDDLSMRTMINFDVIFCANVLIYFDQSSKTKVVNHLYNSLLKGGYLFIGYSETLHGISRAFKLESFPKAIGYKKD